MLIAVYRNYRVGERSRQERESLRYKRFLLTINFTAIGRTPIIHGILFLFLFDMHFFFLVHSNHRSLKDKSAPTLQHLPLKRALGKLVTNNK